jgi:3-phenylpropionate/cinnamic acid dioxygenase small subunit
MITAELQREIEQFFYSEARLLDQGRFHEWLDLFADDVRYRMPTRDIVQGGTAQEEEGGLVFRYLDENKTSLLLRVRRLDTGMAHVEVPPSLTRRLISNIIIQETDKPSDLVVRSNFIAFQARKEKEQAWFVGEREDRLRKVNGQWKIADRKIVLDHPVLPRTLSIFF